MVANKHTTKIIIAIMACAVIFCFAAVAFSDKLTELLGGTAVTMEYEKELFDTDEIIDIDIIMDEDEWSKLLENALSEEYYVCDVKVNGKTFRDVAIRPKGNTSLSSIAMDPDTDRYSLKLEFGHYIDGQTCYGLDKLILNNNYADATNMKEAIVYDMYQYLGADASLYNYAKVSVNGDYWGVYLALEGVEDSFMLRNYGTQDGELYKPDSMEMGGEKSSGSGSGFGPSQGGFPGGSKPGDNGDSEEDSDSGRPSGKERPSGGFPGGGGGFPGGGGGFPGGGGGANLNYTDDDLDSYQTIWDGSITDTSNTDHKKVVTALKNISEGTDLEEYLDVDNVLRYMAVHTFSVNMDSLSGSMAHNYYLYEHDGQLNIFPWDYNLSFGGMMGGSSGADSVINDAIDTPFAGTEFFDALLENEEYLEIYHTYLKQLVEEYVEGGRFDETYNRIRSQIDELVETDPTAFYSYDEYETAAKMLYETVKLRAQSIEGQLNGTIPSTDDGQCEDSSTLIDASDIDISAMGQFNMGGGKDDESDEDGSSKSERRGGRAAMKQPPSTDGEEPSFSGFPGQTDNGAKKKNLIIYGICLGGMIVLLIVLKLLRRKTRIRHPKPDKEQ